MQQERKSNIGSMRLNPDNSLEKKSTLLELYFSSLYINTSQPPARCAADELFITIALVHNFEFIITIYFTIVIIKFQNIQISG